MDHQSDDDYETRAYQNLYIAVANGAGKQRLKRLLQGGNNWQLRDEDNWTLLHTAVYFGNVSAASYFLSLGENVNAKTNEGVTPLMCIVGFVQRKSATRSFSKLLKLLLENKADVNVTSDRGDNPLFLALRSKRPIKDLGLLIKYHVNWKATNDRCFTALHIAVATENVGATKYLISKGIPVNARNINGFTPLHQVVVMKEKFAEMVSILVDNGADVNAVDDKGDNVLFLAAMWEGGRWRQRADFELLVEKGCDWKSKNRRGQSILHYLALHGNVEALQYFLSLGADVNQDDGWLGTPLHLAGYSTKNFRQTVNLLLISGAEINSKKGFGMNVLFIAISDGKSVEKLEYLVKRGAEWRGKVGDGTERSVLHVAAQYGHVGALQLFISKGANVHAEGSKRATPLHRAVLAKQNFLEVVGILLDNGADINAVDENNHNVLFLALLEGKSKEELEYLVSRGADWKIRDWLGRSLLHVAAVGSDVEILKWLISMGADVNAKNNEGYTCVAVAAMAKRHPVEILREIFQDNWL